MMLDFFFFSFLWGLLNASRELNSVLMLVCLFQTSPILCFMAQPYACLLL